MKIKLLLLFLALFLAACGPTAKSGQPEVEVWKSPTCHCCSKWVDHLRQNGFSVRVHNESAMKPLKTKLGVPQELASCHTAVVGGYVIEGHVPAEDIHRLLSEKPKAIGLSVPGMPIGSPGMEQGDRRDPYETRLFDADGSDVFAVHGAPSAQGSPLGAITAQLKAGGVQEPGGGLDLGLGSRAYGRGLSSGAHP